MKKYYFVIGGYESGRPIIPFLLILNDLLNIDKYTKAYMDDSRTWRLIRYDDFLKYKNMYEVKKNES